MIPLALLRWLSSPLALVDVIKMADFVIDLGPEGGHKRGELIAAGTPEEIAARKASHTGRFLAEVMRLPPGRASRAKSRRAPA